MVNLWIKALKEFNQNKGMWCMPKKGTSDYLKVKKIMDRMKNTDTKTITKKTTPKKEKPKKEKPKKEKPKKEKPKKTTPKKTTPKKTTPKKTTPKKATSSVSLYKQIEQIIKKTDLKKRDQNTLINAIDRLKSIRNMAGQVMSRYHIQGVRAREKTAYITAMTKVRLIKDSDLKFKLRDMIEQYTNKNFVPYDELDFEGQVQYNLNKLHF